MKIAELYNSYIFVYAHHFLSTAYPHLLRLLDIAFLSKSCTALSACALFFPLSYLCIMTNKLCVL
jgi:hypothetical protein